MEATSSFFNTYSNFNAEKVIEEEQNFKKTNSSKLILSSGIDKTQKVLEDSQLGPIPSTFQFKAELIKNSIPDTPPSLQLTLENAIEPQYLLRQAIQLKIVALVKLILTGEPEFIHLRSKSGRTLMHEAADLDDWGMLELLLKEGGDILACDQDNISLLHLAALKGHQSVSAHLIKRAKVLIEMRDKEDRTPLHFAAHGGHIAGAALLLNDRAWLEAKDKRGWTPLHTAAFYGKESMILYLLSQGANYQALDKEKKMPEDIAEDKDFHKAALLFNK